MKFALPLSLLLVALTATAQAQAPGPAPCVSVYDVISSRGLTQFQAALDLDDLQPYLSSPQLGYTVFAPSNAAFTNAYSQLDTNATEILYSGHLDALLQYHFLLQPYTGSQLVSLGQWPTNNDNETLSFSMMNNGVMVTSYGDEAMVTTANIPACGSIVHIIDHVLLPDFAAEGLPASI